MQQGEAYEIILSIHLKLPAQQPITIMLKEGYIANWKNYPESDIKIRVARPSILAPSKELLKNWKEGKITWKEYESRLKEQIFSNPKAVVRLSEIKKLAGRNVVRLMCYEKKPPCHRFTLMKMINEVKTNL